MRHLLLGFLFALGLLLVGSATDVAADSDSGDSDSPKIQPTSGGSGSSVPEIDTAVAGGAMVLLLGGVAYLASRKRKGD